MSSAWTRRARNTGDFILEGTLERSRLDVLSTTISDFDFEAALIKLDKIAERVYAQQVCH